MDTLVGIPELLVSMLDTSEGILATKVSMLHTLVFIAAAFVIIRVQHYYKKIPVRKPVEESVRCGTNFLSFLRIAFIIDCLDAAVIFCRCFLRIFFTVRFNNLIVNKCVVQ